MKIKPLLGLVWLIGAIPLQAQDDALITSAEEATRSWLGLTDAGQYAESWNRAASLFQRHISSADWDKALTGVRSSMGAMKSRETASADYSETLPGAPDGEYVVFRFNTVFENKASAVETVTAMKDKDGEWRVAGYFIS